MKYIKKSFMETVSGSKVKQEQWDAIFGPKIKLKCPNGCTIGFVKRKDYFTLNIKHDEWFCKACHSKAIE